MAPPPATVRLTALTSVLDAPVHSLALGQKGRVAALGADAWLDVGKGLHQLPKPPANDPTVTVYFGRDDQPRLMGTSQGRGVYARFRKGGWERGASEIGKLGSLPMAPLFGVLGYDDPEVVCAPDRTCIIKRHTGWTMIVPPPGQPRVELCGKVAWAWDRAALHRLDDAGWRALDTKPTFSRAEHLWAVGDTDIWLAEREPSRLHHFDGNAWKAQPSVVQGPRAVWATSATDVWVAADGGAAHFDGASWRRVEGLPGPLSVVTGRGPREIWFAGQSGVWRATHQ
ncbi:MAG: hypothetical protein IT377_25420 [Polyangiaceae bacterium]|nr:hypothetical protein [Polyangiaceae bacterium]